jgi:AraC-like DNA-binding protein
MNKLSDIEFIGWTHHPACNAWIEKYFDYFVLDYAESGRLLMQIDNGKIMRIKGPVVFLTFPGPFFRFGRHKGCWDHRFISFKGQLADHFMQTGLFPTRTPVIPIRDPQRFNNAFDELLKYMNKQKYGVKRAAHMLEGLLLQLHEQPAAKEKLYTDPRIGQVIEKIESNPERDWNFKQLAAKCALSYPHFRRLFTSATGMAPGNFLISKRMEKAGKLLQQPAPPTLQETASLTGYEDIYYFNKSFSKFHGIPPGRYRDNFQMK